MKRRNKKKPFKSKVQPTYTKLSSAARAALARTKAGMAELAKLRGEK